MFPLIDSGANVLLEKALERVCACAREGERERQGENGWSWQWLVMAMAVLSVVSKKHAGNLRISASSLLTASEGPGRMNQFSAPTRLQ
jgi:hypothetical protein